MSRSSPTAIAVVKRLGNDGGFAVSREAFDADLFRIDLGIWVGFEVIDQAADAPLPGSHAPQSSGLRGSPLFVRPMMPVRN